MEKSQSPMVSIIIPVYNGSDYLREAIDSALAQTYANKEILVVNDGSADEGATENIALCYGDKIRYFAKENGGVATALNMGIANMRGEYFSWLSHDDWYRPQKLAHQIDILRKKDPMTILYGGFDWHYMADGYEEPVDFVRWQRAEDLTEPLFPLFHNMINGCTLLIHRDHFNRVGLFDPTLKTTQDYDLWLRMFRGQKVYCCPTRDVVSRRHDKQGSLLIPGHREEASRLWIAADKSLTETERVRIGGTPRLFYEEALGVFEKAAYESAAAYYREKAAERRERPFVCAEGEQALLIAALIDRYHCLHMEMESKAEAEQPKTVLQKAFAAVRNEGWKATLRRWRHKRRG